MAMGSDATLTMEFVTPGFIGGSHPRGEPEFRIPSLRGVLRYWWRALYGVQYGGKQELQKAEAKVFGDTSQVSAVRLWVPEQPNFDPQGFENLVRNRPGLGYLWFAARKTRGEPERSAIPAGTRCQIRVAIDHRAPGEQEQLWRQFYAALWLFTRLGGIGTRARRGAGGMQVVAAEGLPFSLAQELPLEIRARTPEEFGEELQNGLRKLRQELRPAAVSSPPRFHVLDPQYVEILVAERSFSSWQEALQFIGGSMQQFRRTNFKDDARIVANWLFRRLKPRKEQTIQRAAFGLPIPFFFRQARRGATVQPRRGSPLFIRMVKLASPDRYAVVLTFFKAKFLNASLELSKNVDLSPPDYNAVEQWLDDLDRKSVLLEVEL